MSQFYETNPADPEAPRLIPFYEGLTPGMNVRYTGPMPLPGPLTITELVSWPGEDNDGEGIVMAVLNDGEYEVDATNLAPS